MATATTETVNHQILDMLGQMNERLGRIEQQMATIVNILSERQQSAKPWWEQIAGTHKNDPFYAEMVEEMRRRREEDYAAVCAEIDAMEAADEFVEVPQHVDRR